jgi:hypothetical protein
MPTLASLKTMEMILLEEWGLSRFALGANDTSIKVAG